MKRTLTLWSVAILMFCGMLALADEKVTAPVIEDVRLGVDGKGQTRLVLDMDDRPDYQVVPMSTGGNSLKIEVARGSFALANGIPKGTGLVSGVAPQENDVVFTLTGPALPVTSFVIEPSKSVDHYRLVVDIKAVEPRIFADAAATAAVQMAALPEAEQADVAEIIGAPAPEISSVASNDTPPMPSPKPDRAVESINANASTSAKQQESLPPELLALAASAPPEPSLKPVRQTQPMEKAATKSKSGSTKTMVVIDAGHGGHDPGAIGSTGLKEKTVTLASARELGKILKARGYEVSMLREDDTFIDVHDRIEIARDLQADLFISIHADANPEPLARGASVYTLSEDRNAKMAKELASTGNFRVFDVDVSSGDDVSQILYDLANSDTKTHSSRLATALISEMRGRIPMVNNTHRKASLQTLLSPDVPAVLVELAFLSNNKDEANLGSSAWRKTAMTAIADGIDAYFESTKAVQASASSAAGGAP